MKKLQLNKKAIAQLDKIVGGEVPKPSIGGPPITCANLNGSCAAGKTCHESGALCTHTLGYLDSYQYN